jgi:hypothetical protein
MLSQEGVVVIMKGEGVLSLLVFLHQLAVSIIGTLMVILHLLRFVVFQYNLNNLKDTLQEVTQEKELTCILLTLSNSDEI